MHIASTGCKGDSPLNPVSPRAASTVVLLRDGEDGLQTLLLKRNKALMFAGGFWVFPGGAVDKEDIDASGGDKTEASRLAARREALEEAGIAPNLEDMVYLSHWTTPEAEPRRFATWFYAAPVCNDSDACIDGGEIHDSRWVGIDEILAEHAQGRFGILPPTFVTLYNLRRFDSVEAFRRGANAIPRFEVMPVLGKDGDNIVTMYPGDAGYHTADGEALGPRHRLRLENNRWRFCYEGLTGQVEPIIAQNY